MRKRNSSFKGEDADAPLNSRLFGLEAIDIAGIFVSAVCHSQGVDILDCDDGRYLQTLREKAARYAAWSLRTFHLALLTESEISVYAYSNDLVSMKPMWKKEMSVSLLEEVGGVSGGREEPEVMGLSFQYPHLAVMRKDSVILHNCLTSEKYTLSSVSGSPSIASLSYSGRTLALCSVSSPRIDFMRVHKGGCSTLCHKDHSGEVKTLIWRPGFSTNRDMVLACDKSNLVRVWAVEYKPSYNGSEVHAEVHLLLELCDYVDRVAPFSWVQHGLSSQAEVNFINGSLTNKDKSTLSTSISSLSSHFSGSWLSVLDETGTVRLWCIHAHGISNHIECALKGHGPLMLPTCKEPMTFQSFIVSGRFLSVGADKPISLQVIATYRLGREACSSKRQLITIVHAETIKRSNAFVASTQRTTEFIVNMPSHDSSTTISPVDRRLPPRINYDWQLVSWDSHSGDACGGSFDAATPPATQRLYRALHAPLHGTEAMLWCWSHRHKSYEVANEMSLALPYLSHEPIDIATAGSGFEISHDVWRALWLPQPMEDFDQSKISAGQDIDNCNTTNPDGSVEESEVVSGKQHMVITLQQPRLGSCVVAIWQTQPCAPAEGKKEPNFSHISLAPRDDDAEMTCRMKEMGLVRGVSSLDKRDTEITPLHGSGGFDVYEVSILPDPHFGLGLRLDICDGKILVESFKRNPLTTKPMPAEECGIIGIGDELMSVTGTSLKGQSLVEVIQIIRQVVQNARGSAVVLQLRACNRTSIDSEDNTRKFNSNDERTFSVDDQSRGWYANTANSSNNSISNSQVLGGNDGRHDFTVDSVRSSPVKPSTVADEDFLVRIPSCKKWNLVNSFPLENIVVMDIILGDYGESVASGNCTGGANDNQCRVVAIAAAISRIKTVANIDSFDLDIFEIVINNNDPSKCGLVQRLSTPWKEREPTTLQLWSNPSAAQVFTLAVTHVVSNTTPNGCSSEMSSIGMVTILEVGAVESETSSDFVNLSRSVSFLPSVFSWALSPTLNVPVVFNRVAGDEKMRSRTAPGSSHCPDSSVQPKWELLCCPVLEGGKHLVFKNVTKCREVCIVQICEGEVPEELLHIGVQPSARHHDEFHEPSPGKQANSEKKLSCYGKFMQNIPFSEDVRWAKFLDDSTLQIGVGNKWFIYSLFAESSELWMLHSEPAIFNGIHSPEALSLNAISRPNPWSNGYFASVSDHAKRGISTSHRPDWHPVYVAADIFSLSQAARDIDCKLQNQCTAKNVPPMLQGLVVGLYKSIRRLALLSNAMKTAARDVYQSYPTKLLQHDNCTTDFDFESLIKSMSALSRDILAQSSKSFSFDKSCSPPLQLLRPCDIVFLTALGRTLGDMLNTEDKVFLSSDVSESSFVDSIDFSAFADMDAWAVQSFLAFKVLGNLDQLKTNSVSKGEDNDALATTSCTRVSGDVVLNALVSSTQNPLYDMLVGSDVDAFSTSLADRPQNKKDFNFSMLWWARNQAGKDSASDYDILGALAGVMAPVWLRDLSPVCELVEKLSTAQFRDHRDSLKIFLELVVVQKTDKLLQLAKTDRNVMGKQLLSLLGMDFKSERGRQACHKNAFALLRLQRYKHAAAVFLCAEPPLLKEAVRVIIKHLNDPVLALLISRLVERRADAKPMTGGFVLGPISRSIIENDILPALYANISQGGCQQTDVHINMKDKKNPFSQHWGADAGMLAISCSMWLQDGQKLKDTIDICCQCDIFRFNASCSPSGIVKQLLGSCSSMNWLMKQTISPQSRVGYASAFDSMLQQSNLTDLRFMGIDFIKRTQSVHDDCDPVKSFTRFCEQELLQWKQRVATYTRLQSQTEEEKNRVATSEPEFEDVTAAMKKLQSISSQIEIDDEGSASEAAQTLQKKSKGFNLSMSIASKTSTESVATGISGSALDVFDAPPPKPKPKAETNSMLDMFDAPPPKPKPKPKAEPASMLDMFDAPPPKPKPKAEPASMLDMFDAPPPKPKAKPKAEPASMLDMFDAPPPKPKPKAEPASMLDMFDAPPPKPKPKAEPASMLDMFDAPPPKPKSKPKAEPASMLDMFDAPPPKPKPKPKAEPTNMLDMFDAPPPKPKSKPKAEADDSKVSDVPNASVISFNNNDFNDHKVIQGKVISQNTMGLISASRSSIIARCFDELQLSLGCIPTMSHPLATSGQTRELLKAICSDIRSSLVQSDAKYLQAFRKCLRSLSDRYFDLILPYFRFHSKTSIKNLFHDDKKDDALNSPPDTLTALYLLENVDFHNSVDLLAMQVLLRWASGYKTEEVNKIIISAVVSVFELFSVVSGAAHNSESSNLPFSASAVTFMMITARQMQLILSLSSSPVTSGMLAEQHRLRPAIVALLGMTIRICMTFASLDYRYDITQKLLKYPPKFDFTSLQKVHSPSAKGGKQADAATDSSTAYDNWLAKNPILSSDAGHLYFRDIDRPEAIAILKQLPKGCFLLRPHEKQESVVYLSFVADSSGAVKHAIIRNDLGPTNEPNYRCGKVGPCATVEIALRSISKILPTSLIFDPTAVPEGPSSFVAAVDTDANGQNNDAKELSEQEKREKEEREQRMHVTMTHFGSFSGDIPEGTCGRKTGEAVTIRDVVWDPNGEFWFSLPTPELSLNGYRLSSHHDSRLSHSVCSETASMDDYNSNLKSVDSSDDYKIGFDDTKGSKVHDDAAIDSWEHKDVTSINSASNLDSDIDPAWSMPLCDNSLGSLVRGIAHMLSVKTIFRQITISFDNLNKMICNDPVAAVYMRYLVQLRYEGKIPHDMLFPSIAVAPSKHSPTVSSTTARGKSSKSKILKEDLFPRSMINVLESFVAPLSIYLYTNERVVLNSLSPALPLDPTVFISHDFSMGESLMEQILHERIGVPLRHVKLPHAAVSHVSGSEDMRASSPMLSNSGGVSGHSTPKTDGGDDVVECIESVDVVDWIKKHMDTEVLSTMIQSNSEEVVTAEHVLKWLWDKRVLQNIVIEGGGMYSAAKHNFFRYIDPWEVSVVRDHSAVLSSTRLGRGWYGAVSAYSAADMVESVLRHIRKDNNDVDGGFVKLWESLRAEAWLVMSISTSHEQGEREAGGPAVTELTSSTLGASDPYHSCLARHLYRNALFERIRMPHRFVAVLQIDTFALKDLSPHKYISGVASTPIEVYAVARLVRSGGRKSETKALTDTLVTPARKIEANKQDVTSQPSEYSWREQGVLRFPLPDSVLAIGPFTEGSDKNIRQPPRKLQLSVYETRSFFSDQKLGELELPLSGLSDERPFRDWLPLSSEKGAAWFVHVQMQLRFMLMTKDEFRDSTIRSRKGQSKKVSKLDDPALKKSLSRFGTPSPKPTYKEREPQIKHSSSLSNISSDDVRGSMGGPIAAPVMYSLESIPTEVSTSMDRSETNSTSPSRKVEGVNDLMSDFF